MIHAGMGAQYVNSFLTTMNIPPLHHKTMKKREREIGNAVDSIAKKSCLDALADEKESNKEILNFANARKGLSVSSDAVWQTRGTGRSYNSDSGHGALIGKETGKCLEYSVKSKICRICQFAEKFNEEPREHNCLKNWSGSSKGMEPAMAVDMLKSMKNKEAEVGTLIMDNDSTTIARAREIHKESDQNHTKKALTSALYAMQNQHKNLKNKKVLDYIVRRFMYAVQQNQGNETAIKTELGKIVPHIYGEHNLCVDQWCKYKENPDLFKSV